MAWVHKWRFEDPYEDDPDLKYYTLAINPNSMSAPFPERAISAENTVASNGNTIIWEGNIPPAEWQFSGFVLTEQEYENLRAWVYDKKTRLYVRDHFKRRILIVPKKFEPTPKRSRDHYWAHQYTISCLVLSVGAAGIGDDGKDKD